MKNRDIDILKKMIKYCEDFEFLMKQYDKDFNKYENDISMV